MLDQERIVTRIDEGIRQRIPCRNKLRRQRTVGQGLLDLLPPNVPKIRPLVPGNARIAMAISSAPRTPV